MNVEIGTEAAQCPGREYINGIFVAVYTVERISILSSTLLFNEESPSTPQKFPNFF